MSEFTKRSITFSIALGTGALGLSPGSEIKVEGLRVSASYTAYNGLAQPQFHMSVFGMPLDMINELTAIGPVHREQRNNVLTVQADGETIFKGTITVAYGDFQSAPDVVFNVIANAGAIEAVTVADPLSYPEETQVSDVLSTIAGNMGLSIKKDGVDGIAFKGRCYNGTNLSQLQQICREAHLHYLIDQDNLYVWAIDNGKNPGVFDISPETGMVGYPQFNASYLVVTTLLNPQLICGSLINVSSQMSCANGQWQVLHVTHELESEIPNGAWFTRCEAQRWNG